MPISEVYNTDCMEYMRTKPDGYFDLAIVDPPYGIGIGQSMGGGKRFGNGGRGCIIAPKIYKGFDDSQIPSAQYFIELRRISKNQIIWGGNYFIQHLFNTSCMIVWDKDNSGKFADCELAWTSFTTAVRKYKYRWNGLLQENMKDKEVRIHPTHKPIALYKWLLQNYAKQGDKILDTHLGSGSSRIAAYDMAYDFYATELDKDYYEAQEKRFKEHCIAHGNVMFKPERQVIQQQKLL